MNVIPARVETLLHLVWGPVLTSRTMSPGFGPQDLSSGNEHKSRLCGEYESGFVQPDVPRKRCLEALQSARPDTLRYANPTQFKVAVTQSVFNQLHSLWDREVPTKRID